jgi:hypothetical protein
MIHPPDGPTVRKDVIAPLRRRWSGIQVFKDTFFFSAVLAAWIATTVQYVRTDAAVSLGEIAKLALFWVPSLWLLDNFSSA